MHLAHPGLTLQGKRKGKVKFRNAEQARQARELAQEWERKQQEWAKLSTKPNKKKNDKDWVYSLSVPAGRETEKFPSLNTAGGVAALKPAPTYTGTEMLGITIVHKSGLQPVFNEQSAKDAASMRR